MPRAASNVSPKSETASPKQVQDIRPAVSDDTDGGVEGSSRSVTVSVSAAARPSDPSAPVPAPITLKSIVTDALTWVGLGRLAPSLPVPNVPVPPFFEGLWLAVRGFQRTVNNQRPAAHPTLSEPDPDGTIRGNVNATDFDGDPLTYSVSKPPTEGEVSVDSDGGFTYKPGDEIAATGGTDSFTIKIDDGATHGLAGLLGLSGPATATVKVTVAAPAGPVDHAPVNGVTDVHDPDGEGKVTGTVTATDPDGDTLTYSRSTPPSKGAVVVNDDGSFTYTPTIDARHDASANGAGVVHDGFTVTVSDGNGGTLTVPVSVIVSAKNSAPSEISVESGSPDAGTGVVTGAVHATDADQDTLTYTVSTQPGHAQQFDFDSSTGAFTYKPTGDARNAAASGGSATDSFTVSITDGHGGATTTDVSVTVAPSAPVNNAPVATDDSATTNENVPVSIAVVANDSDTDGDSLIVTGVATPLHGTVTHSDTDITYTPNTDYYGADGFTYTVSDGHGGTATGTVSVTVAPVDAPPLTGTPVDGLPLTAPVTTLDGTVYQLLSQIGGTPASSSGTDSVAIINNQGSTTVVTLPGAHAIGLVGRPGGDAVVTTVTQVGEDPTDDGSYLTQVSVIRPNGTISTTDVVGSAIASPVVAANGITYQMVTTPVDTGIVADDGTHVTAYSVLVLRVDPGGAVTTHTLGAVPGGTFYGRPTGNVVTDAQGNGYVAIAGATVNATAYRYTSAIMVIPAHGTAYLSDLVSDNPLVGAVAVTPDGTAYAPFLENDGSTMVMELSGQTTTFYRHIVGKPVPVQELPTIVVGAGGAAYLVTTSSSADGEIIASHITRIGGNTIDIPVPLGTPLSVAPDGGAFQMISVDQVLAISPGGGATTVAVDATQFVLGPDGKGYAPTAGHVTVVTTGGTTSDIELGGIGASPLVFGPDGTPFAAVDTGSGYVIKNLATGASSDPLAKSDSTPSGGTLAIGPDGTVVFVPTSTTSDSHPVQILAYAPDGSTIISSPVDGLSPVGFAFGPDGTVYVPVITQGGDGSFGTTVVTVTSTGATTGPTVSGFALQLAATDRGVYAFAVSISVEGGFGNTQLVSLPAVPNTLVPATTVTKTVNNATGVVTGQVTAGSQLGEAVSWSGSTTTALGSLVVGSDGTFTFTPSNAARAYAEESGKVYNVIGSFTATNSAGQSYTIPFNVPLLPTNYPVSPSTSQLYPLHTFNGAGTTFSNDPDSLLGQDGVVSSWFGEPALVWTDIHQILTDGRDLVDCNPCNAFGDADFDYSEVKISYTGHPDLTQEADGTPINAEVYVVSLLHVPGMKYYEGYVIGYRKMAKGNTIYVKSDMLNHARVVGDTGEVKEAFVDYEAIEVVPGTFPEDWFYQRDPNVGGFIFDNELPSDALVPEVDRQYTEFVDGYTAYYDTLRSTNANLAHVVGKVGPLIVDPETGIALARNPRSATRVALKVLRVGAEGALEAITDQDSFLSATMFLAEGPAVGATPSVGIPD
ncbi:tandem-95 repeat protein [Mycobacterium sp. SA01]|uniref:Ig-like domain-containing protein n=1 Tax=Mycobacterium sp. SA01 TaxID=3238820 RepID=UPI00351AE8C7